jgi:hypothetical protein
MFCTRWTYLPTLAGFLEYVDLLKGWVKERQASGQRMALLRDAAPAEGFRLQTVSFYEKLSELDSVRDRPSADFTVRDWINSTAPITRSIWQMEMFEIIDPMPALPEQGDYSVRFRSYPDLGLGADARISTVDTVTRLQSRGFNVGAAWQQFARGGAITEWDFSMKRIGDWEELSKKIFADPDFQADNSNAGVMSRPSSIDLWEVVIAAPPAKK